MKRESYMFFFLMLLTCTPSWGSWQRSITNYARHSYKAASQNWMIMQCDNGWMYFANNNGLLEFDGTNWSVYPIHNAKMRAVKAGNDGRIYVGGLQQFGYFVPDSLGRLDYVCLSDTIDKKIVGNIWNIHVAKDRVFFQSDNAVFCFEKGRIHRITCNNIVHSALVGDQLYVAGTGLFLLNGDEFTLLPNTVSEIDNVTKRIVGIFSYQDKLLVVRNEGGLLSYENGVLVPFQTSADDFLKRSRLFCADIKDSILALGTVQDGLML